MKGGENREMDSHGEKNGQRTQNIERLISGPHGIVLEPLYHVKRPILVCREARVNYPLTVSRKNSRLCASLPDNNSIASATMVNLESRQRPLIPKPGMQRKFHAVCRRGK